MAFDAAPTLEPLDLATLIDAAPAPDRAWAKAHPDRFLALMFVAPQACEAIDDLLEA